MAVSDDRKYTKAFVHTLLEGIKGKTLGEVDKSHQFARTEKSEKITGIAGDIIEESVLGCKKDSKQEPDILVDGVLTELKTTGMIEPKKKDSPYVYECVVTVIFMHTSTNDNQHRLQEIQFPYTSHNINNPMC